MDISAHNTHSAFKIVLIRNLHCANVLRIVFSYVSDKNSYLKWGDKVAQSNCLFFEIVDEHNFNIRFTKFDK